MDPIAKAALRTAETFQEMQNQLDAQWTVIWILVAWNVALTVLLVWRKSLEKSGRNDKT